MKLGLNLSFAAKRWQEPKELADMCSQLGVKYWQFNLDFVDPMWPVPYRDELALAYREAFAQKGLCFDSVFGGMSCYALPQLLAFSKELRAISMDYYKKAIDIVALVGANALGLSIGRMTHKTAYDPALREEAYQEMLKNLTELAEYGAKKGIKSIEVEPVPVFAEEPNTPAGSLRLAKDLWGKTAIPVKIFLDWGHTLYEPLLGKDADMALWIRTLRPYLGDMHLQQTDGKGDRHWDYRNPAGRLIPEEVIQILNDTDSSDFVQYLEFCPAYEATDEDVLDGVRHSIKVLRTVFAE